MNESIGKWVILLGAGILLFGLILYWFPAAVQWIGRLPGDIHIQLDHVNIYIPITTMILLSIVLTLVLWIVQWMSR